jgi:hypothetical protein
MWLTSESLCLDPRSRCLWAWPADRARSADRQHRRKAPTSIRDGHEALINGQERLLRRDQWRAGLARR